MKQSSLPAVRFALLLLLPVAMSACSGGGSGSGAGNATATIRLADPGPAAETVNGEEVPERLVQAYARSRNLDLSRPDLRQRALKDLANIVVTAQAARDAKLYDDPDFAALVEMMRLQSLATATAGQLQRTGPIDDATVRAEYDKMTQTTAGTDYAFTQLIFRDEATAKKVAGEIAKGKPFDKALEEHKTDALQARRFQNVRTRQMPEALAKAIEEMKPGEVSRTPVQTPLGWHVIHLETATAHAQEPYDAVKERIRSTLQKRAAEEKVVKLRSEAKIVVAPAPAAAGTPAATEKKPATDDAKKP
jgi:peptidyl-prolyl cis-trans isomerase C